MKTIKVLQDIIIPKDAVSGSASDAKVHEFIGYIVKEKRNIKHHYVVVCVGWICNV